MEIFAVILGSVALLLSLSALNAAGRSFGRIDAVKNNLDGRLDHISKRVDGVYYGKIPQ